MHRRPYQVKCINNILEHREKGKRRQLVVSATGTGKTVIFGGLTYEMPKGAQEFIIAHQEELIFQAAEKVAKVNPACSIGIEMAGHKADGREDVVVASIQTLSKPKKSGGNESYPRLEKFDPSRIAWLVVDEAHHGTAPSYGVAFSHLLVNPFTTLVGFTATPNRPDGVAMGAVFKDIVFQYSMLDAIEDGWLVEVHGFMLKTGTDISKVGTYNHEFKEKELAKAINTPQRNERLVKGWITYCWPRQTIIFTKDVQHAKDLAAAFQRQNIRAAAVWGEDPDRKRKLDAFRNGELQVLINCRLLVEGFDMWQVECVIPASPMKSQSNLIQEVGRGTRLQEGVDNLVEWRTRGLLTDEHKNHCLVMDPLDNLGRHSLATLPSLFGLSPNLNLQGASVVEAVKAIKKAQERHPNADLAGLEQLDDLEAYAKKAELWNIKFAEEVQGFSELQWTKRGNGSYRILLPQNGFFWVEEDLVGKFSTEGSMKGRSYKQGQIASLAEAVSLVEKTIANEAPEHLILLGREQKWMKGPVSKDQMKRLRQFNVPHAEIVRMNRGQAAAWLTQQFNKRG